MLNGVVYLLIVRGFFTYLDWNKWFIDFVLKPIIDVSTVYIEWKKFWFHYFPTRSVYSLMEKFYSPNWISLRELHTFDVETWSFGIRYLVWRSNLWDFPRNYEGKFRWIFFSSNLVEIIIVCWQWQFTFSVFFLGKILLNFENCLTIKPAMSFLIN